MQGFYPAWAVTLGTALCNRGSFEQDDDATDSDVGKALDLGAVFDEQGGAPPPAPKPKPKAAALAPTPPKAAAVAPELGPPPPKAAALVPPPPKAAVAKPKAAAKAGAGPDHMDYDAVTVRDDAGRHVGSIRLNRNPNALSLDGHCRFCKVPINRKYRAHASLGSRHRQGRPMGSLIAWLLTECKGAAAPISRLLYRLLLR